VVDNSYIKYSQCSLATTFWNKPLFIANITKVYLTIDGIYSVVDYVFGKYLSKHDKSLLKLKTTIKNLQNMIET
jgi:hypothetical protein